MIGHCVSILLSGAVVLEPIGGGVTNRSTLLVQLLREVVATMPVEPTSWLVEVGAPVLLFVQDVHGKADLLRVHAIKAEVAVLVKRVHVL